MNLEIIGPNMFIKFCTKYCWLFKLPLTPAITINEIRGTKKTLKFMSWHVHAYKKERQQEKQQYPKTL